MPRRSEAEHYAAAHAMHIAKGNISEAVEVYKKLVPGATIPRKRARYFKYWAKKLGEGLPHVAQRLGRPKKIGDALMMVIATVHVQRMYYSHGRAYFPRSVAEVGTCWA